MCIRDRASPSVCVSAVDGLQQSVNLTDGLRGSQVTVAKLTIAFTGTSFDMDKFPDRPTQNGVTNGNVWYCCDSATWQLVGWSASFSLFVQFNPSSSHNSSLSSYSCPSPLVDFSRGIFHFPFLKVFPSVAVYSFVRLISWNYDHSVFGSHWRW